MKFTIFILLLCMVFSSIASASSTKPSGCDYTFKKYCAKLKFLKPASRSYSSDFELRFYDLKSNKLIIPTETVYPYLWMKMDNGHEHGSSEVEIKKNKDYFLVKNVWFVMIGSWELFISLKDGDKVIEKKVKKIQIGR